MTRELVIRLRREHFDWSLAKIGQEAGVTRERVRQIFKEAGLHTGSLIIIHSNTCEGCGKRMISTRMRDSRESYCSKDCIYNKDRITLECDYCHEKFTVSKSIPKKNGQKNSYCSMACRSKGNSINKATTKDRAKMGEAEWVTTNCGYCGAEFKMRKREYERRSRMGRTRVFCNQSCFLIGRKKRGENKEAAKAGGY